MFLPTQFKKNIIDLYQEKGKKWLNDLPEFLEDCENKFKLKLDKCYLDANFNYVAPALLHDGSHAVLKCSIPNKEFKQEMLALQHYNGKGCVQLLFCDYDAGIMLLEKAEPGDLLESFSNLDRACEYAVQLMHQLHKPLEHPENFLSLHNWFDGFNKLRKQFDGKTGPFPEKLIDRVEKISKDLLASMNKKILLHGDLHYANILSSEKHGWIVIDPKGIVGEPEFEIPLPRLSSSSNKKIIQNNLDRFIAISGFDKERIINWLFVKTVLAAWWSFEDNGEIAKPFLQSAEYVYEILN